MTIGTQSTNPYATELLPHQPRNAFVPPLIPVFPCPASISPASKPKGTITNPQNTNSTGYNTNISIPSQTTNGNIYNDHNLGLPHAKFA